MPTKRGARLASREAGSPLPVRGTCLKLWRKSEVKAELWRLFSTPHSRPHIITPSGPVEAWRLTREEVLAGAPATAWHARPAHREGADRSQRDRLLDAWLELLLPHFADGECCFFTGTYADAVGYAHGMTLPRNVLRDFKRTVADLGLDNRSWVVCAEPHVERDLWHLHALLADCGPVERQRLEEYWTQSRGWSRASELHDGGVAYTTKYAVKSTDAVMFDWSLR